MQVTDFEYDSQFLSDYKFIICDFSGSTGVRVVDSQSKISFEKNSRNNGKIYDLVNSEYSEPYKKTFDICKDPDFFDMGEREITSDEYRDIVRWLNRKEFLNFRFVDCKDRQVNSCHYKVSFNIQRIEIGSVLCGIRLNLEADSPYPYGDEVEFRLSFIDDISKPQIIEDKSDDIGSIYPDVEIICKEDGDLTITNELLNRHTVIKNCKTGEIISLTGNEQIIKTSYNSHKNFSNDFNYQFFQIGNYYNNRLNPISVTKKCELVIRYSPSIKYAL